MKFGLLFLATMLALAAQSTPSAPGDETQVALVFSGGHETEGEDHGRPVVLIAAALNVPPEVFREAFRHVKPAAAGEEPQEGQVRLNKQALLQRLGPYGVTDDRLNEVSNYYRYARFRGEMWPTISAEGFATVRNGVVTGITVTKGGAGYSSPPQVSLPGVTAILTARLVFGTDLKTNGAVGEITVAR
jgi:hypothetical protein